MSLIRYIGVMSVSMCFFILNGFTQSFEIKYKDTQMEKEARFEDFNNQAFGFNMLSEISKSNPHENILISPLSISIALHMVVNGARGSTQKQILQALQTNEYNLSDINEYYKTLINNYPNIDSSININVANSLWYDENFKIKPSFVSTVESNYEATIKALDFKDDKSVDSINNWVTNATQNKIEKIIEYIPEDVRMYLINAVYFKGKWTRPFDQSNTSKQAFFSGNEQYLKDFMFQESRINYAKNEDFEIMELPYGNQSFSMIIILPSKNNNPENILSKFKNGEDWEKVIKNMTFHPIRLWMPKFKLTYENTLNDELKDLGMERAFTPSADFIKINKRNNLFITEVKHKTFIDVNEEGTEAAGVTSIGVGITSMPEYQEVKINRPFLFFIQEKISGNSLFAGMINMP